MDNSTKMSFGKLIHDMYDPNPKAQRIIQHIARTLMGLYTIGLHLKNVIEGSHRQFVVAKYGIWYNLHDLSKMICFGLMDFIKPNFVSKSCCHV
jgi:hypothetical protein